MARAGARFESGNHRIERIAAGAVEADDDPDDLHDDARHLAISRFRERPPEADVGQ